MCLLLLLGVVMCVGVCQASLQGPEVQLTLPSDEELSAFTAAAAAATSSSSTQGRGPAGSAGSWASASISTSPAAAGSGAVGMGGVDLEKRVSAVVVFEGQVLSWTLCLTNISPQPITGCKVRPDLARYSTCKQKMPCLASKRIFLRLQRPDTVPASKECPVWLPKGVFRGCSGQIQYLHANNALLGFHRKPVEAS